jgi:uncharacterized protein (TIGR01777 family)
VNVFMTGGTGFVGTTLSEKLLALGHGVTVLTRSAVSEREGRAGVRYVTGDPTQPGVWQEAVAGHEVIINLAGASIFKRWTKDVKQVIRDSRIRTTRNLVHAISGASAKGTVLFSTSAIGYYGFRGDEMLDEESAPGNDFLARLSQEWEAEALQAVQYGARVIICRFGIVLGASGGALAQMIPVFKKGMGSPLGTGKQWFSWVHEQDLVDIYLFLLDRSDVEGPVNCTAPNPVRNKALTEALARAMRKPAFMPSVPGFMVKIMMGEFGSVLLEGQKVMPKRLLDLGFPFRFPRIEAALQDLLG